MAELLGSWPGLPDSNFVNWTPVCSFLAKWRSGNHLTQWLPSPNTRQRQASQGTQVTVTVTGPFSPQECYLESDQTSLYHAAKGLMTLQALYGTIPQIFGKGECARVRNGRCFWWWSKGPLVPGKGRSRNLF